ncbi:nucleoside diphosphate kinase regulator [bacterium]|nr:nucleoside diphosphate kinase regulator [bacterium]
MSELDIRRFRALLDKERTKKRQHENISRLESEIQRAEVLPPDQIPADVVTMHSLVRVREKQSGQTRLFHLVYPEEADPDLMKISILDPIGLAVIGEKVGATVPWDSPQGRKWIVIEKMHYQPESEKNYFL